MAYVTARLLWAAPLVAAIVATGGCGGAGSHHHAGGPGWKHPADEVLNELHAAAAAADEERYFSLFAPGSVFLGTDPAERWTLEEFRTYAHERFKTGEGWTYKAVERHARFDDAHRVLWFDEIVRNEKYGDLRGSGVLVLHDGEWKIAQYNLSKPIPNDIFVEVVRRIDEHAGE